MALSIAAAPFIVLNATLARARRRVVLKRSDCCSNLVRATIFGFATTQSQSTRRHRRLL